MTTNHSVVLVVQHHDVKCTVHNEQLFFGVIETAKWLILRRKMSFSQTVMVYFKTLKYYLTFTYLPIIITGSRVIADDLSL